MRGEAWVVGRLAAIWLLATGYNLLKPYHMDDAAHLQIATWIMGHPLHPMSGLLNWSGVDEPIFKTNQPHLYFYVLALWASVLGFSEPALHSLQAVATLICVISLYRISRAVAPAVPIWITALVVLSPAFIVEQNLMVDVPLLAAWLVFFEALLRDPENGDQHRRYLVAGASCAVALLIKYSSLVLVPILCASLLIERRRAQAWAVLVPLGALLAWSAFNVLDFGGVHILQRPVSGPHPRNWTLQEGVAWIISVGALSPVGLALMLEDGPWLRRHRALGVGLITACFVALAASVAAGGLSDRIADKVLWAGFLVNGAAGLAVLWPSLRALPWRRLWRWEAARPELVSVYLGLWVVGTSLFYILLSPFVASRHVLLILAPLALLFARGRGRPSGATLGATLALTVVVSAGLCASDWRFAGFYRDASLDLGRQARGPGAVWVGGHWGWQWYASRQGMREIDTERTHLDPGDRYVASPNASREPPAQFASMKLVNTLRQDDSLVSLFCTARVARFYVSTMWTAPWSLSPRCSSVLDVYEMPEVRAR